MRSHKCKWCKKYIGETFKDFASGTVDTGEDYFCSEWCYFKNWLNCWGNRSQYKESSKRGYYTQWGKGYDQAIRDVNKEIGKFANEQQGETK